MLYLSYLKVHTNDHNNGPRDPPEEVKDRVLITTSSSCEENQNSQVHAVAPRLWKHWAYFPVSELCPYFPASKLCPVCQDLVQALPELGMRPAYPYYLTVRGLKDSVDRFNCALCYQFCKALGPDVQESFDLYGQWFITQLAVKMQVFAEEPARTYMFTCHISHPDRMRSSVCRVISLPLSYIGKRNVQD